MKKEFTMVLMLLVIGVTAAYGQITDTITGSGDFPDGTTVNVSSPPSLNAVGVDPFSYGTIINFLGSSVINVDGWMGIDIMRNDCIITFAGVANIIVGNSDTNNSAGGLRLHRERNSVSFLSDLNLKVTDYGTNSITGIEGLDNTYITVAGVADVTVEGSKNSDAVVQGINGYSTLSFSDLTLKVTNPGTGYTMGIIIGEDNSSVIVNGVADITINVTNKENASTVYGIISIYANEVSFGAGSSVKINSSGTGPVYGVYIM